MAVSNPDNAAQVSEVAACLGRSSASGTPAALYPVNGNLFCCMPLPFSATGLPVHVNGSWRLQSNRRELWTNIDDERKLVRCMCFTVCRDIGSIRTVVVAVCQCTFKTNATLVDP